MAPSPPPDPLPFDTSPVKIVLNCPHIVDSILRFANQSTLATLLRVNQQFYDLAGPLLYHTVRLDDDNMDGFFEGAIEYSEDSDGERCWYPAPLAKPKSRKGILLSLVRVLSLASHNGCLRYDSHAAGDLLSGLDTLRLVPTPMTLTELEPFCGLVGDIPEGCPFLTFVSRRKVVVRNMDANHSVQDFVGGYSLYADEEEVWVLPTKRARFPRDGIVNHYRDHIPDDDHGTIVFEETWETWKPPPACSDYTDSLPLDLHDPVKPKEIAWGLFDVDAEGPRTVYGLETVELGNFKNDRMLWTFRELYPNVRLTQDRLQRLVKEETSTGELYSEFHDPGYDKPEPFTRGIFKTLADYAALDPFQRRYVLDDGTDPHFFEP